MANPKPAALSPDEPLYCPLFPEPNDEGVEVLAKDIKKVEIFRQLPGPGRHVRRIRVSRRDYRMEGGGEFEINPFETTEDDLEEQFGGGEYYIQAIGHNGRKLPCGRTIFLSGPVMKNRQEEADENEEDEAASPGYGYPAQDPRAAGMPMMPMGGSSAPDATVQELLKAQQEMVRLLQDSSNKRADDVKDFAMSARREGPESSQLVNSMREDLDEARKTHRMQLEDALRKHRDEMDERRRELDEERRRFRKTVETIEDEQAHRRRALEAELDRERQERRVSVEQERERYRRDMDEERKRRLDEVEEARRRADDRVEKTTRDSSDIKTKLEKRIDELQREVFDLRKTIAETPSEPPEPPSLGETDPDAPWFKQVAQAAKPWIQPIVSGIGQRIAENAAQAQAQAQAQAEAQAQARVAALPSSQYVSPPQYAPSAPPPPPPPMPTAPVEPPPAARPNPVPVRPPTTRRFRMGPSITVDTTVGSEDEDDGNDGEDDEDPVAQVAP